MQVQKVIRETNDSLKLRYFEDGKIKEMTHEDFNTSLRVEGSIRIHKKDFKLLPQHQKILTHFNLEVCYHKVGKMYALPIILERGYLKKNGEELTPLLDISNCKLSRCIDVKEYVKYDELSEEDFKFSFPHIKSIEDLKKEILWRYSQSLPDHSNEELLELGVSITTLELMGGSE